MNFSQNSINHSFFYFSRHPIFIQVKRYKRIKESQETVLSDICSLEFNVKFVTYLFKKKKKLNKN